MVEPRPDDRYQRSESMAVQPQDAPAIKPLRERLESAYLISDKAQHFATFETSIVSKTKSYWDQQPANKVAKQQEHLAKVKNDDGYLDGLLETAERLWEIFDPDNDSLL